MKRAQVEIAGQESRLRVSVLGWEEGDSPPGAGGLAGWRAWAPGCAGDGERRSPPKQAGESQDGGAGTKEITIRDRGDHEVEVRAPLTFATPALRRVWSGAVLRPGCRGGGGGLSRYCSGAVSVGNEAPQRLKEHHHLSGALPGPLRRSQIRRIQLIFFKNELWRMPVANNPQHSVFILHWSQNGR